MKTKYKERAIEILGEELFYIDGESYIDTGGDVVINAMCQLAEEVEKEFINKLTSEGKDLVIKYGYTKEQVEELLEKQRELCANKAKYTCTSNENEVPKGEYFNLFPFYYFLDRDSVLNAKLKID